MAGDGRRLQELSHCLSPFTDVAQPRYAGSGPTPRTARLLRISYARLSRTTRRERTRSTRPSAAPCGGSRGARAGRRAGARSAGGSPDRGRAGRSRRRGRAHRGQSSEPRSAEGPMETPATYSSIARSARPARRSPQLALAPIVEPEDLVRVPVLLVVVDEARVRRRGDDRVEASHRARPASRRRGTRSLRVPGARPCGTTSAAPACRGGSGERNLSASSHGSARAAVLVAPVRLALRHPREVEVEVRRQPRGARRAREDDAQDVGVLVPSTSERKCRSSAAASRREPLAEIAARPARRHALAEPARRGGPSRAEEVVLGRS